MCLDVTIAFNRIVIPRASPVVSILQLQAQNGLCVESNHPPKCLSKGDYLVTNTKAIRPDIHYIYNLGAVKWCALR